MTYAPSLRRATVRLLESCRAVAVLITCCVAGIMLASSSAWAQAVNAASGVVASPKAAMPAKTTAPKAKPVAGARWVDLTPAQQKALSPLAASWNGLSEGHKRKWIVLAQNFTALSEGEKEKMHARMGEWAALSVQQRNQARQNFAATTRLGPDDKKAQWEAYQALSDEEKERLAARAYRPRGAAPAIRPASDQKLAIVPTTRGNLANPPKIVRPVKALAENAVQLPAPAGTPSTVAPAGMVPAPESAAAPALAPAPPAEPISN